MNNSLLLHQKLFFFSYLLISCLLPLCLLFFLYCKFWRTVFRAVFMIKNVHFFRNYLASRYIMFHSNILINDIYKRWNYKQTLNPCCFSNFSACLFGGYCFSYYLCTRFRTKSCVSVTKKRSLKRFT